MAIYTTHPGRSEARRAAGSWHRFLTLEMGPDFLRTHFGSTRERLKEPVIQFMESTGATPAWLEIGPLPVSLQAMRRDLLHPPVPDAARPMWYRAKAFEILAQTLFAADESEELFCQRHQRQNRERIDRVCYLIERDLENPPSLDMLAQEVACSPFHLSRVFAEQAGMSIPRYLRTRRIERAAELLKSSGFTAIEHNMTGAALQQLERVQQSLRRAGVGCRPGAATRWKIRGRKPRQRA